MRQGHLKLIKYRKWENILLDSTKPFYDLSKYFVEFQVSHVLKSSIDLCSVYYLFCYLFKEIKSPSCTSAVIMHLTQDQNLTRIKVAQSFINGFIQNRSLSFRVLQFVVQFQTSICSKADIFFF